VSIGIIYVNTAHEDGKYILEAEKSCLSFKEFIPEAEYFLCTDASDVSSTVFDKIILEDFTLPQVLQDTDHKNGQMVGKLKVLPKMEDTKHDMLGYFGSDVYALSPLSRGIFDVLDKFDLGIAHAPHRINTSLGNSPLPMIPATFPELNGDLIVWRNTSKMKRFFEEWRDMYLSHELGHPHDQGAFRYLAYMRDIKIAIFPPEYNFRGKEWRRDTVILQNRNTLPLYINGESYRRKQRRKGAVKNLLHRVRRIIR